MAFFSAKTTCKVYFFDKNNIKREWIPQDQTRLLLEYSCSCPCTWTRCWWGCSPSSSHWAWCGGGDTTRSWDLSSISCKITDILFWSVSNIAKLSPSSSSTATFVHATSVYATFVHATSVRATFFHTMFVQGQTLVVYKCNHSCLDQTIKFQTSHNPIPKLGRLQLMLSLAQLSPSLFLLVSLFKD